MKGILLGILLFGSYSTFANCRIKIHKKMSAIHHEAILIHTLEMESEFTRLSSRLKQFDYGLMDRTEDIGSGKYDVFGDEILLKKYTLMLYEKGNIQFSASGENAVIEVLNKLKSLRCY